MENKKKNEKKFNVDVSLLDPNISDEKVSQLFYEGSPEKLFVLVENPRFSNFNKDVFKYIAKEKDPISFNHPWFRISLYLAILFVLGIVQIFPFWITGVWFVYCIIYYTFNFKAYNLSTKIRERERINFLNDLVIGSPFEPAEAKRIREKRERMEALSEIEENKIDQNIKK